MPKKRAPPTIKRTPRRGWGLAALGWVCAAALPAGAQDKPLFAFFDRPHAFVSNTLSNTVGWFDHFFAPLHEEIETNQSYLRVTGSYAWTNGQGFRFRPRARLRIRVPALQNRLSLVIAGEDRRELDQLPAENRVPQDEAVPPPPGEERTRQVGLQYNALRWLRSRIDVDAGLRSQFEAETDARFRQLIPLGGTAFARFTETGFWREKSGFGQRTQLDLEETLSPSALLSWQNAGITYAKRVGMDWDSALVWEIRLSAAAALNLQGQSSGVTHPQRIANHYRLSSRYRRNVGRPWFFLELEPGVDFDRNDHWRGVPNAALRAEVLFRKTT